MKLQRFVAAPGWCWWAARAAARTFCSGCAVARAKLQVPGRLSLTLAAALWRLLDGVAHQPIPI
jgi:hypothetical protein